MREILFRGKRKDNEWKFGFYYETEMAHIILDYDGHNTQTLNGVIPETVGQFTGYEDFSKNKIFEDDIVKVISQLEETGIGVIRFICGEWVVDYQGGEFDAAGGSLYQELFDHNRYSFEVIGNIHDNPELLETR